jgi:hypothetical protein
MTDIVYFIASYGHCNLVRRLVRTLHDGDPRGRVLVQHDPGAGSLDPEDFAEMPRAELLSTRRLVWGGMSQVEMLLHAIRYALQHYDPAWMIYLSGQDHPLRPLPQIRAELLDSDCDGYVDAAPIERLHWQLGRGRYLYRYPPNLRLPTPLWVRRVLWRYVAWLTRGRRLPRLNLWIQGRYVRLGFLPSDSPFKDGMRCYQGSNWWTLSNRALRRVLDFVERRPDFEEHYRHTPFTPNESFFLTIVLNDETLKIRGDDNLRYISWSVPDSGHPDVLTTRDLPELLASGKHFARKLDPTVDPELVERLEAHVRGTTG